MSVKINDEFVQVKELDGYPYNRVGEKWTVYDVKGENTILKNGELGLGVNGQELKEYFEKQIIVKENKIFDTTHDVKKVIRNGQVTVVILRDGSKGKSKCLPEDTYDADLGYEIAYTRAQIKSLSRKLKRLTR